MEKFGTSGKYILAWRLFLECGIACPLRSNTFWSTHVASGLEDVGSMRITTRRRTAFRRMECRRTVKAKFFCDMAICKRLWQVVKLNIVWGPERYRNLGEYYHLWLAEHILEPINITIIMAKLHSGADSIDGYRDPGTELRVLCQKLIYVALNYYTYPICRPTSQFTVTMSRLKLRPQLRRIGNETFRGSRVVEIHIPDSVEELCGGCFCECKSLSRVTFGESPSLKLIRELAFYESGVG